VGQRFVGVCIENNHSTIMARRKRAESLRFGDFEGRLVVRLVVVSCALVRGGRAFSPGQSALEKRLADWMAESIGFEPTVAV
jgi:hypothetical protein